MARPIGGASGPAATTSMAADDTFIIWRDANNDVRVITRDNAFDTVPQLASAQTFSALQTFSAGISLGNETLSVYDTGTWTPVITGSTSNPTVTYTTQTGRYTQFGDVVFYHLLIIIATISGGSGFAEISLPSTSAATSSYLGACYTRAVELGTAPNGIVFRVTQSAATGRIIVPGDNVNEYTVGVSDLAASDQIWATGLYFV